MKERNFIRTWTLKSVMILLVTAAVIACAGVALPGSGVYADEDSGTAQTLTASRENKDAEEYYYYSQMKPIQQKYYDAYKKIALGFTEKAEEVYTRGNPPEDVEGREPNQVYIACYYEHPELYWVFKHNDYGSKSRKTTDGETEKYLYLGSRLTQDTLTEGKEKLAEIDAAVDEFMKDIDLTAPPAAVALQIHDKFEKEIKYGYTDSSTTNNTLNSAYNMYGALVEHTAVCEGIAQAYTYLLRKAGIEAVTITGTLYQTQTYDGSTTTYPHAWNMVKLGGEWYEVDCTTDRAENKGEPGHYLYNRTTEQMAGETEMGNAKFVYERATNWSGYADFQIDVLFPTATATHFTYDYMLREYLADDLYLAAEQDGKLVKPAEATEKTQKIRIASGTENGAIADDNIWSVKATLPAGSPFTLKSVEQDDDGFLITVEKNCLTSGSGDITVEITFDNGSKGTLTETLNTDITGDHSWNSDHTEDKAATCTEAGSQSIHCKTCSEIKEGSTETIPATGHDYSVTKVVKTATCTEAGSKITVCKKCGETKEGSAVTIPATGHSWSAWKETKAPTVSATGTSARTCSKCGAKQTKTLAKLAANSARAADQKILKLATHNDLSGAVFNTLQAKYVKATNTSVKISWKKISGAKKYVIYANKCGSKYKKCKTITGNTFTQTGLTKGTYYKYLIVALNASDKVTSTSKVVHIATTGGKVGNDKSVTTKAKKNKVALKKGKTFSLTAKAVPVSAKLTVKRHRAMKYETSNKKIATISAKGVIKGIKKGTCYVFAYTQNGVFAKIKVTVK